MRVEELVGSLQTFELLLPKPQNSKNIALKINTIKGKFVDLFDEFGDDEQIAMMARKFKKFLRNNGNSRSRESKNLCES
jgi:hypothetical protein